MEDSAAKYKRHWEKLEKDEEAWEAKKKELHRQLEDAQIKVAIERIVSQESVAKAENQGYQHSQDERKEFFQEFLETLACDDFHHEGYFKAYVKYIEDYRLASESGEDPDQVKF